MTLIISIFLFLSSCELSTQNPIFIDTNAPQLLSHIRTAIHTKNLTALSELLTPEVADLVIEELGKIKMRKIPVHNTFEVTYLMLNDFPNVTYIGKKDRNCSAIYSKEQDKYLLNDVECVEAIINRKAIEDMNPVNGMKFATVLLEELQNSIQARNWEKFLSLVTSTAQFITMDGISKNAEEMFNEIRDIQYKIPVHKSFQLKKVVSLGDIMVIYLWSQVKYIAKYSENLTKWMLERERGGEYYSALVNHTALREVIANETMNNFKNALALLSPERLRKAISNDFKIIECDGNVRNLPKISFFQHFFSYPEFYTAPEFKITEISSNFTNGSMKFVVEFNHFAKSEMTLQKIEGIYRIVIEKHLKCEDLSSPNSRALDFEPRFNAMRKAEQLMEAYNWGFQNDSNLITDNYEVNGINVFENGVPMYDRTVSGQCHLSGCVKLSVVNVNYEDVFLRSFRAENGTIGVEFQVRTYISGLLKLASEKHYEVLSK